MTGLFGMQPAAGNSPPWRGGGGSVAAIRFITRDKQDDVRHKKGGQI